ncbi:MAG: ExbD/TolR family protein [Limnohabitans sp.]
MQFGRPSSPEPEINLIPFIDVLLVVIIFLMLTTTYGRLTQLDMRLPRADSGPQETKPQEIRVAISSDGRYMVQKTAVNSSDVLALTQALSQSAQNAPQALVVIAADAQASHQSVIQVLEAAQQSGLQHVTFAAQSRTRTSPLP